MIVAEVCGIKCEGQMALSNERGMFEDDAIPI